MKYLQNTLLAVGIAFCAQNVAATPYCENVEQKDALPSKYQKRAPFLSDAASGWIIGADQLKTDYVSDAEVRGLWARIAARFEEAGTQLVVLAPPPRPLFTPEETLNKLGVSQIIDPTQLQRLFSKYIADLNAAGIVAPDLSRHATTSNASGFYFQRDTHWTPFGAYLSAAQLAENLGLPTKPAPEFDLDFSEKGSLSSVVAAVCDSRPVAETTKRADYPSTGTLLGGASQKRVALVGTSFSDRHQRDSYQVADALSYVLDADVVNASHTGSGMNGAMLAFLADQSVDLGSFETVIWENPYTTPMTNADGLRAVLGELEKRQSKRARDVFTGLLDGDWQNIREPLDSSQSPAVELSLPGLTVGRIAVELIAGDKKYKVDLRKSERIPTPQRSDDWVFALDQLPHTKFDRLKVKILSGQSVEDATVRFLQR